MDHRQGSGICNSLTAVEAAGMDGEAEEKRRMQAVRGVCGMWQSEGKRGGR